MGQETRVGQSYLPFSYTSRPRLSLFPFRPIRSDPDQSVCNTYVCGQTKGDGMGEPPGSTAAPEREGSMGGDGVGTTYDGSFSASDHRSNSNHSNHSSAGSQGEGEAAGLGGGWATMQMGMDAGGAGGVP